MLRTITSWVMSAASSRSSTRAATKARSRSSVSVQLIVEAGGAGRRRSRRRASEPPHCARRTSHEKDATCVPACVQFSPVVRHLRRLPHRAGANQGGPSDGHQPSPARLERERHRGRHPLLHRHVRRRPGQATRRLRQLRDRRPAAQAGAVRAPDGDLGAQPPRRRGPLERRRRRRRRAVRRRRSQPPHDRVGPLLPRRAGQGVGRRPRRPARRLGGLHRPRRRPRPRHRDAPTACAAQRHRATARPVLRRPAREAAE